MLVSGPAEATGLPARRWARRPTGGERMEEVRILGAEGGELAVGCDGDGMDRVEAWGQGPPLRGLRMKHQWRRLRRRAGVDPAFEQVHFLGSERRRADFVLLGGHDEFVLARDDLVEEALRRVAFADDRSAFTALHHQLPLCQTTATFHLSV